MLTVEANDLVTKVTGDAPMGMYFREFWLPFLFSNELEVDGPPERIRLLGEDLIAFRNSEGKVGLIGEHCPHRYASLFYGRNEEGGMACVYHGWKFSPDGTCLDMPSEPEASNFRDKVKQPAYPCEERGGVVWAYMGDQKVLPALPDLEWMDLPADQIVASKRIQYTNWLQGLEGEIDQSHLSFTHRRLKYGEGLNFSGTLVNQIRQSDKHPVFETINTEAGVCIGSGRKAPDGQKYWRISQWLTPSHIMTGPYGPNPMRNWRMWVPVDDVTVLIMGCHFHPNRAIEGSEREKLVTNGQVWNISPHLRLHKQGEAFAKWHPKPGLENDFFIDRQIQKTESYSGIEEFWAQDAAPQISMGPITPRNLEHLGTSDLGIIAMRKRLLSELKAFEQNKTAPPQVNHPEWYRVRSDAAILASEEPWYKATAERRVAYANSNPDCP